MTFDFENKRVLTCDTQMSEFSGATNTTKKNYKDNLKGKKKRSFLSHILYSSNWFG
jgi:hypothetical protein